MEGIEGIEGQTRPETQATAALQEVEQVLADLEQVLADADLGALLLRRLTVQEAGRLGGACRTARGLVRRGEAWGGVADSGLPFRPMLFRPLWSTAHVLVRLERFRQPFFAAGGLQFRETTALARLLLDELRPAGVIELRFELGKARGGRLPSLLGCHELRVVDVLRWVHRLREWALRDGSCFSDGMDDDVGMRQARRLHPGSYMLDLLRDLGLKPTGINPALFGPVALAAELRDCRQLCPRMWVV
jgi:hypothetical protein